MKKLYKISITSFISITLYVILNFLWDSQLADKIATLPSPVAELINNYIAPVSIIAFFFCLSFLIFMESSDCSRINTMGL